MKINLLKRLLKNTTASLVAVFLCSNAKAATLYWDTNGTTSGVGGTGNWTTTGTTWSTDPNGTTTTVSGGWTSAGTGPTNIAVFQGTAGQVTLSSSTVYANNVQVNSSGYTFWNSGTTSSQNRYIRSTNGITLGAGVNLNWGSSGAVLGITGPINGGTGSLLTIVGSTDASTGVNSRIGLASNAIATVINVPMTVATTGTGYAVVSVTDSSTTNRINGNITINNGSRLILGTGSSTSRALIVSGDIASSADGALSINESGNTGLVELRGSNTITGDINVYGQLGYANKNAFGTARLVLNQGATLGQSQTIGDNSDAARMINNNILLNGDVTIGGLSWANILGGNIDLNNATRSIKVDNSTTIYGGFVNSSTGLIFTNSSSSVGGRTMAFNGASTYSGNTYFNSSGTGWNISVNNTNGSAFGTGNVYVYKGTSLSANNTGTTLNGNGIIAGTIGGDAIVSPGNSPGLLTVGAVDPSGGMSFAFEITSNLLHNGTSYNNDVLKITNSQPFTVALTSANVVNLYLNSTAYNLMYNNLLNSLSSSFQTGFFNTNDFNTDITNATYNMYFQSGFGTLTFNGLTYETYNEFLTRTGSQDVSYSVNTSQATLADSNLGYISTVNIIPEPSPFGLLVFGSATLLVARRLRRNG